MIPLCAPNTPLCAHIMSREVLVVVLRWIHIRSNCPLLGVVLESNFFHFQECTLIGQKGAQKALFSKDEARILAFKTSSNLIFSKP